MCKRNQPARVKLALSQIIRLFLQRISKLLQMGEFSIDLLRVLRCLGY